MPFLEIICVNVVFKFRRYIRDGKVRPSGPAGLFAEPQLKVLGSCWTREKRPPMYYVLTAGLRAVLERC